MSSEPLNPCAFDAAIAARNIPAAWSWAQEAPRLSLSQALTLTVLLGYEDDGRYTRAANRFLERYQTEAAAGPDHEAQVRRDLERLGREGPPPLKYGAGERLKELAGRLGS